MTMRLDRFLSNMGEGSRKDIKALVKGGAVLVDGKRASDPGMALDPDETVVTVGGRRIFYRPYVYLMMNKPGGVISATEDARGQKCAVELVGEEYSMYELAPAGRLDVDTEGFLLLTNDGSFIHDVISPKKHVFKTYYAELDKEVTAEDEAAFGAGMELRDGTVFLPGELTRLPEAPKAAVVRIREGKFHQVKRMFAARGLKVLYLKRTAIGGVEIDPELAPGEYRELTEDEKERILHE